jgi:predicted amidohydrolase YtcJ
MRPPDHEDLTVNKADLIITSARVWDGASLIVEALAMGGGRIMATGSNRQIMELAEGDTEIIDVGGRRVIPGLIDSHLHLVRAGRTRGKEVRWDDLDTLDDALSALRDLADELGPGRWVGVIGGWHPNQFAERRMPSRDDLDAALPDNPVFVQRAYAETSVNSRAMSEMGWSEEDAPEGRVTAPAAMAALRARLSVTDLDEAMAGTRSLLRELNRLGLTGAIDASGFGVTADSYDAFFQLFAEGERGFRARMLLGAANPGGEMEDIEQWVETIELGGDDAFVRYLGAGEVLDYAAHDMEGLAPKDITARVDALRKASEYLARHDWPVHFHSILDSSISVLLDAWERLESDVAELRWAICHADQIGSENLKRVRDLGVGITIQNGMSMRGIDCAPTWSSNVLAQAPPMRTMLDHGIPVAAGTDGTVACAYNPWRCIAWMVTGESVDGAPPRVESERLSRDEALRLYTSASAWFSFEEDTRGTLRDGAHADLAVLSADPLSVGPADLADIESVLTVVSGEVVHSTIERARLST